MKKRFLLTLCVFFSFSFFLSTNLSVKSLETLTSDWSIEEEEEQPSISATELETREAKIQKLETIQKQQQLAEEQKMADIAARRKGLIECLDEKGVTLFMIEDCEQCKTQKAYFGDDFKDINYVDCNKSKFTCPFRGIKEYPTWYLGNQLGIKKAGVRDLESLSRLTNCAF